MNTNELVTALDVEIARLTQIRNLLADVNSNSPAVAIQGDVKRRGRPKGSKNKATSFDPEQFAPKRRTMSAAGKARIAAAQRARWAKQKREAAVTKSRPFVAKAAVAKPSLPKQAAKKIGAPAKPPAKKPLIKAAASARAMPAKKAASKGGPAKKASAKPAAKTASKQPVARKQAKPKGNASGSPALPTSVAEGAATAPAE